jgi:presenilin-like A22 family membrane protease
MDQDKKIGVSDVLPVVLMAILFVVIQGLALLVVGPFYDADMQAFEDKDNPMNLVIIFLILLGVTAVILLIAKFWKKRLIQVIILGAVGYTAFWVFRPLAALIVPYWWFSLLVSILIAVLLVIALVKYPEWYIIDICGIIIGAGAIAIFGISLGIFLVIILLIGLAIYDAISVYKTKHMIDLADTVMDLKLPVLLVIPKIRHYSLLRETKRLKEQLESGEKRDAFFMGLGDVVMPGILVATTYHTIENGLPLALSVMIGTLVGFFVLMTLVMKGKPHAGLPLLCSGAILGYVIGSFLFFGELVGLSSIF